MIKQQSPIKIAFFHIMGANFSGAAKNIFRLLNRINLENLHPVLVGQAENELTRRVRQRDLDVFIVPYPYELDIHDQKILNLQLVDFFRVLAGLCKYNGSLKKFYKKVKPRVVWADNIKTFFFIYAATKQCRCKIILNIMSEPQGKVSWLLHRLGLFLADVVNLEYKIQGKKMFGILSTLPFFQKKMVTLYSGVTDFETKIGNDIRKELELSSIDILLLMASDIVRGKGQLDLIKSIKILNNKYPHLNLLLAGQPSKSHSDSLVYDSSLKQYVSENNLTSNVHFLGWRSDMPDLFNAIDIYVSTSYSESFPDAVREAMLAGNPIVVTNVGGTCELVKVGVNGYLFEPGDIHSLVTFLDRLVNNSKLRDSMGVEGKRIIEEKFSTKVYAKNFEVMVQSVVNLC